MQLEQRNEVLIPELFDALPESVLIFKPIWNLEENQEIVDFEVVYCNRGASIFLRTPKDKILGARMLDNNIIDRQYQKIQFDQCMQVWQTERPFEDTFYNERIERYFDVLRSKVSGLIISITKDRTEYYFTERIRQQEAQKFKGILDASADGLLLLESVRNEDNEIIDFRIAHCNQAGFQLGSLANDVIGKRLLDVFPHLKNSDQFEQHKKVVETGIPARIETSFRKENSVEYGWFIVSLTKLGDSVISVFVDITEKKLSEQKFKEQATLMNSILQSSPSGISVIKAVRDKEGNIVDGKTILANEMTEKYTGLPNQLFLSLSFKEIDPKIFESPIFQMAVSTLQTGETCHSQYFFNPTGRWLEISLSRMDEDHLINVFTDITIAKEAQLKQEKLLNELKKSNASLEEFAYAASHDLKEPIRKIHFFGQRIKDTMIDRMTDVEKQYFERMEAASKRMAALIDDLLSYSQISIRPRILEEVNMNLLIDQVLEDLDLEIEDQKANVEVDKLFTVQGHHRQLQQAFQNLISNAIKYSKPGIAPLVQIKCSKLIGKEAPLHVNADDQSKTFYCISVVDNGIGFEQSEAERIFNVFTRLHGLQEYKGTGIGLSLVRKVIENHNGYIWAQSETGKGSTFNVLLPAK